MEILKHRKEIDLSEFSYSFSREIRYRTKGIRTNGASVDEYLQAYADVIEEDFQTVKDVATIAGHRPSSRILEVLGMHELSRTFTCSHGLEGTSYTYAGKDYEKSD